MAPYEEHVVVPVETPDGRFDVECEYLLACVGHPDAWPVGDLALQEAARLALALDARPTEKEKLALGERWRR